MLLKRFTTLDDAQTAAMHAALTHQLALIQGPPGTGKTFLGIHLTRILLANGAPKPIVTVCYTNHALDQFLEGYCPSYLIPLHLAVSRFLIGCWIAASRTWCVSVAVVSARG